MAIKPTKKSSHLRRWAGSVEDFCTLLQSKALTHNQGFCHYTILRNLAIILKPCKLADGERLLFRMSSAEKLNDGADLLGDKKVYVLSLLHSVAESVAMWSVYGVPKKEAVRIRFPKSAVAKWLENAQNNSSPCFFIKDENTQSEQYRPVTPTRIRFADVLYVSRMDARFPYVGEHDGISYGTPDKTSWKEFAGTQPEVGLDLFFKNRGWAYEKESRLVIEFDKPLSGKNETCYVYVDFTKVIRTILTKDKNSGSRILLGPWFDDGVLRKMSNNAEQAPDLSTLLPVIDSKNKSHYFGELKMRSVCELCDKANKQAQNAGKDKSCNCPFMDSSCIKP